MDIVQHVKDKSNKTWYKFLYFTKPDKWIIENEANQYPGLINAYLQRIHAKESEIECSVDKTKYCLNKKKTRGMLTLMFPCGFIINFKGLLFSEGLVNVCTFLNETSILLKNEFKYIIYDNACKMHAHVKGHQKNYPSLVNTSFLIDRFHIKNHKAKCLENYNCDHIKALVGINSERCESENFLLNRFKFCAKHMTKDSYNFFFINYFNFQNTRKYDI